MKWTISFASGITVKSVYCSITSEYFYIYCKPFSIKPKIIHLLLFSTVKSNVAQSQVKRKSGNDKHNAKGWEMFHELLDNSSDSMPNIFVMIL